MRLSELLAVQDEDTLKRLADEHLAPGEGDNRVDLCLNLEAVLRSPKHIRGTVYNRKPPCFWILQAALESECVLPITELRQRSSAATMRISAAVTSGDIVADRKETHLYRRVLAEAWRSDLELDASEVALLGVLRQELGLRNVDHFLIEHHSELRQLWDTDHAFLDVLNGLRSSGIVHVVDATLIVPRDIVGVVRQVLGLEASTQSSKRLFEQLNSAVLAEALERMGLRTSGTKAERIERLVSAFAQPTVVLELLPLADLRDLCGRLLVKTSGTKESLVDRIATHYALSEDLRVGTSATDPPPPPERRSLDLHGFISLFSSLRGQDLSDILASIDATRVTGTKEHLVQLLADSPFCESTLLMKLDGKQLESAVRRHALKPAGSKTERIDRLVAHFLAQSASGQKGE